MQIKEIKTAIQLKTIEFEIALETGKSHSELLKIYKELKELQYNLVQNEHQFETI